MESKIIFLIIAILSLYVLFSQKGQMWLRRYVGIDVTPAQTSNATKDIQKQADVDTRVNNGQVYKLQDEDTRPAQPILKMNS
jgi:hypothetical protein